MLRTLPKSQKHKWRDLLNKVVHAGLYILAGSRQPAKFAGFSARFRWAKMCRDDVYQG